MSTQLPLDLGLRDGSSFENFVAGANTQLRERLLAALVPGGRERLFFLWGEAGSGKTHLLEAACRRIQEQGRLPVYLPLAARELLAPAMLEGIDHADLVAVDDVQAIAGDREWETALLALYERLRGAQGVLLAAGRAAPAALGLALPDLSSRLSAALVYQLMALDDDDKLTAIRLRAHKRGLELSDEVARYVLSRYPRDLHSLFALLERIDRASLAHQRRVTIPFLRALE